MAEIIISVGYLSRQMILNTSIESIETINYQIYTVSKEISKHALENKNVKILVSITGIDMFSVQYSYPKK